MEKIKVNNLKKSYGDLEVLKSIDLQVQEGEVVCLIGPLDLIKVRYFAA